MAILYRHIRKDKNEPFYVGIGKTEKRAYQIHNRNKHWKNIADKGFDVQILFDDLSWEDACKKEIEFIKLYGRNDNGTGILCNMTDGGDGQLGNIHNLGKKRTDPEFKKRMSEIAKNRTYSEETREKMRLAKLGKKRPERTLEHRLKLSIVQKGKPKSEEAKKNMSLSHKNKKPWNYGKKLIDGKYI
jgi:hypothetical protein